MSKRDYDRLRQLHDDWDYKNAIDQLFQQSTDGHAPDIVQRSTGIVWIVAILATGVGIVMLCGYFLFFGN